MICAAGRWQRLVFGTVAVLVALLTTYLAVRFMLNGGRHDDLGGFLEARVVDSPVYPAYDSTTQSQAPHEDVLRYGQAQALLVAGRVPSPEYDQLARDLGEYLLRLDPADDIGPLTASLAMAAPVAELRAAGQQFAQRHLVTMAVNTDDYRYFEAIGGLTRARLWSDLELGVPAPSCVAFAEAFAAGDPVSAVGSIALADPDILSRCGEPGDGRAELNQMVVVAKPEFLAEVIALHEAGLIDDDTMSLFVDSFSAAISERGALDPLLLSLGVATGFAEEMDERAFRVALEVGLADAKAQTLRGPDPLTLWLLQDAARLTGVKIRVDPAEAPNGVSGTERAVFAIMGVDVSLVDRIPASDTSLREWGWVAALDLLGSPDACELVAELGLDQAAVTIVESAQRIEAECGPLATSPAATRLSLSDIESVATVDDPSVVRSAIRRSVECRLGLEPLPVLEELEPYPADLEKLWAEAVMTRACS